MVCLSLAASTGRSSRCSWTRNALSSNWRAASWSAAAVSLERVVDAEFAQRRLDVDELVAGSHQQRVRHVARADAERVLAVLAQFGDERAEVAVAGDDDEGVDLRTLDGDLECVERHANVGAILAGAHAEDLQEIDRVVHQVLAIAGETAPVAIGTHDRDRTALLEIGHQRGQLKIEEFLLRP